MTTIKRAEATLDPDDWEGYRATSHRILDSLLDSLQTIRERSVWQTPPAARLHGHDHQLPSQSHALDDVWQTVRALILPYATGNIHPRFFGWVHGTGTVGGIVAEMIAAAMNSNVGGREHAAVHIERQVLSWAKCIFGFPDGASGILLSGTSMANVVALAIARNAADAGIKRAGLAATATRLVAYASSEVHVSIRKALELIGLGSDSLRRVPVDANYEISVDALQATIASDRAMGLRPFCIIGSAGTVNSGAIDNLARLAELAAAERVWFHVDGAFGALAALSPGLRPRLAGIERADSLAFDFHKWLHAPYAVGCLLVRDEAAHRETFATHAGYLSGDGRALSGGAPWFCDYGPELSRGFLALKVWFVLQEHGTEKLAAMVEKNCEQARYLASLVERQPRLELCAPVPLNVVCFRVRVDGPNGSIDALNQEIVHRLQESGIAAPSTTRIDGKLVIRAAITNHRTLTDDLDVLIDAVLKVADDITSNKPAMHEQTT